jgi:chemosensory pili system protein ChpA (sensor histidine kinase/response regulator)
MALRRCGARAPGLSPMSVSIPDMQAPQPGASQPPGTNPLHADAGVLCWIMPPVLRALETAAAALGTPQADAAALDSAGESLRQAGGALALARVAGAAQVLASAAHLLAQPGASDADRLALCREACTEVRDYVSGLCEGQPQRPCALAGVQRALQSRAGLHTYADLDACFAEGLSLDGALEPAAAERVRGQRERLRRLEELWERCGAGDGDALPAFAAMLRELLAEGLPHPRLVALGAQVQQAVPAVVPERSAALAIATALLFLQDTLAVWPATGATLDSQVDALIQGLRGGAPAPRVDLQQERHRREQARALAARLSAELVGLLRSVQHHLQAFFEEAAPIDTLAPARSALAQTRQVLTLMGEDAAARATDYCTQRVGEWQFDAAQADTRRRTDVAATVCALEYYLEQLAFGEGDLGAILKRAGAPDALHAQRAAAEDALASGEPVPTPVEARELAPAAPAAPVDIASDPDMLQIFLEEAAEVLATLRAELGGLGSEPGSQERLAVVRRAYHTLKGSGRMVGLMHLGDAAWALEQALNHVLQRGAGAGAELLRLLELSQERFEQWLQRLRADGRAAVDAHTLKQWSECIRRGEPLPALRSAEPASQPAIPERALPMVVPERTVDIGTARVSPGLFATFMTEAAQHVSTLRRELEAMARSADGAASYESFRAAHTLAGIAGTTGFGPLGEVAGELERVLQVLHHRPCRLPDAHIARLVAACDVLNAMLGSIARLQAPDPASATAAELCALADRLLAESGGLAALHERMQPVQAGAAPVSPSGAGDEAAPGDAPGHAAGDEHADEGAQGGERRRGRITDDLDRDLLPVFLEEASDLVPQIGQLLRDWRAHPDDDAPAQALKRLLHTLKGSARMAGAMALGELTHSVETRVSDAAERGSIPERVFDSLYVSFDRMGVLLEQLERGDIDGPEVPGEAAQAEAAQAVAPALLRVRAELVDRLVEEAGEVSIARARMEVDLRAMRGALRDLTESVIRLRTQVREVEIQAETQMESRLAQAHKIDEQFDPLEFDRFTRLQELTRFLAEGVSDVAALQQNILETADSIEATLAGQRRTARAVQDGLMRVRLLPVAALSDRLHRVVRLTAREAGKRAELEIRGGRVELDRGLMERVAGPLEHLVRNAVIHGIEAPERRSAAGKPPAGRVALDVRQEGNEVVLRLEDDGQGLDLSRIRTRAIAAGLLNEADVRSDKDIAQLVFAAGLSTSEALTEAAGRGVGLDVVRTEIGSLGGRVQLDFEPGRGTAFTIYLPVTLSVMQAVLVSSAGQTFALPTTMVEQVQKVKPEVLAQLFEAGEVQWQGRSYPVYDLQQLLGDATNVPPARRYHALALLRSGALRVAVYVDDLLGSQEMVVKNIGTQLARVAGIAGAAVLASGESVLILNPIVLTQVASQSPGASAAARSFAQRVDVPPEPSRPMVMVVDDSLTIRRITGRLLTRAGYEVVEARDGVEALEKLRTLLPQVVLLDIEMPRMDGFELTRQMRDDPRLRQVPIIVISSRTADKHRQHAAQLGVNLFLGKPYQEDELLARVAAFLAGMPGAAIAA